MAKLDELGKSIKKKMDKLTAEIMKLRKAQQESDRGSRKKKSRKRKSNR